MMEFSGIVDMAESKVESQYGRQTPGTSFRNEYSYLKNIEHCFQFNLILTI